MKKIHHVNRKLIITFLFSMLASVVAIIHGIFLDADISQIKRLTLEGFIFTFIVVFPILLFLEWMFDLENKEEFKSLEQRVRKLENKLKRK